MVVQRTLDTINNLKERPHHERRAVAAMIAIGVVAVLFLGWAVFFFRSIAGTHVAVDPASLQAQIASAASAPMPQSAPSQAYTNSTDGYIDLQAAAAVQQDGVQLQMQAMQPATSSDANAIDATTDPNYLPAMLVQ